MWPAAGTKAGATGKADRPEVVNEIVMEAAPRKGRIDWRKSLARNRVRLAERPGPVIRHGRQNP
jgi:hypothetical protein